MWNRIKKAATSASGWFSRMLSRRDLVVYTGNAEDAALPTPPSRKTNNGNERTIIESQSANIPNNDKITTTDDHPRMLVGHISSVGPLLNMGQLEIKQNNPEVRTPWTLRLVHTKNRMKQVFLIEYKNVLYFNSSAMWITSPQFDYATANPLDKDRALSLFLCLKQKNIPSNLVLRWLLPFLETFTRVDCEDGNALLAVSLIEPYPTGSLVLETKCRDGSLTTQLLNQQYAFAMEACFISETLPDSACFTSVPLWDH